MSRTWRNWANTERSRPIAEISPRGVEQIRAAVIRARDTGHTVKPIGASHSFTAIGATDGVRLDLSRMRGLVSADTASGQVTLWAGTHLWELPAILAPLGLALENMGDVDRQTITGATQTGTHGTGRALGGLATRIVAATLVTGTGEVLRVSATERPELLPAVALGLGALGVLVTVTIQCVPEYLLRAVEGVTGYHTVLDSFEELSRADHFEFFWFPHTESVRTKTNTRLPWVPQREREGTGTRPLSAFARYVDQEIVNNALLGTVVGLESVFPATTPRINRAIESVSGVRDYTDDSYRVYVSQRRVRFREMEYGVPLEAVPSAVREIRALIERRGYRVSFPVEVRTAAADDLMLSTASGRDSGYIAVHRYWRDRPDDYFAEAERVLLDHSGRPHWGKMHTLTASELRERYPHFEEFCAVRDELDPDRVFANTYLERVLGE